MLLRSVATVGAPVSPAMLAAMAVPAAARVSGAVADAVLTIDPVERRRRAGLAGVEDLGQLDALMNLPVGADVLVADIAPVALAHLHATPAGCVEWQNSGASVRRLLVPVAAVELVVVRARTWRESLPRAAAFEPFATRVVVLPKPPRVVADVAWEADAAGVGLWLSLPEGEIVEIVAPAPFERNYLKPAGWRFSERAYSAWINAMSCPAPAGAHADRQGRSTPAASDQRRAGMRSA